MEDGEVAWEKAAERVEVVLSACRLRCLWRSPASAVWLERDVFAREALGPGQARGEVCRPR